MPDVFVCADAESVWRAWWVVFVLFVSSPCVSDGFDIGTDGGNRYTTLFQPGRVENAVNWTGNVVYQRL